MSAPVPPAGQGADATAPEPWGETRVVGKPLPRIDAWERVSGAAVFTRDLVLPDMLHAAVLRCPHAHARVRRVDLTAAARRPGVVALLGPDSPGADLPWYQDREGKPLSRLLDPHCRYQGEEVAVVAAETPAQAAEALAAIAVEYEVLPALTDMERALEPGAPQVHAHGNRQGATYGHLRGAPDQAFAEAEAVVELTVRTAASVHTPMEVHCSVARWEGHRLTVWDSAQGVFGVRAELAAALGLPLSSVRVVSRFVGGGFGSKLQLSKHTVLAALLARAAGRPVKLALSREETLRCVGNRPPNRLTVRAAARRDGTLTALELKALGTGGAYPASATSGMLVGDLYRCPNVRTENDNVFVNAGPGRPFRAPGVPPAAFALEQVMDALAEKLGLDPLDLRLANVPTTSQTRGVPFTSTGLARCLREGAAAFGWREARARARGGGPLVRGVGLAAGMWGYEGDPHATALVTLLADGSATLNTGAADIGTGTRTVLAQVVAEELGIPLEQIAVENADTATTHFAPASGGSQTVLVNAPAVRAAALEVRRKVLGLAARELGAAAGTLRLEGGAVVTADGRRVPLRRLEGLSERVSIVGVGERAPHPAGKVALPFAAHFAEVEVDVRTGQVRVLRLLAAHDSGRVMNALTFENQVHGGVIMGLGFGLTEERILDHASGALLSRGWHDYQIPTVLDVPAAIDWLPVDPQDRECNSAGAKGLGEPAHIPTAAAVANAIQHATGVRLLEAPMSPPRLAALLARTRS